MKAFLSWHGMPDAKLKELGHNRKLLVSECIKLDHGFKDFIGLIEDLDFDQNWRYNPVQVQKSHLAKSFDVSLQLCAQASFSIRKSS
ncbi:MAG: hypothetical protein KDB65_12100 [Calditrichaeota bacterium]|nr:hypothetical protein [Calditrichota bacterium]MCB9369008.1 hypothetical protein [Calditrichota bacterium]